MVLAAPVFDVIVWHQAGAGESPAISRLQHCRHQAGSRVGRWGMSGWQQPAGVLCFCVFSAASKFCLPLQPRADSHLSPLLFSTTTSNEEKQQTTNSVEVERREDNIQGTLSEGIAERCVSFMPATCSFLKSVSGGLDVSP